MINHFTPTRKHTTSFWEKVDISEHLYISGGNIKLWETLAVFQLVKHKITM